MDVCTFDVLNCLCKHPGTFQRFIATRTGYSLGKVNSAVSNLRLGGLVGADGAITTCGLEALEPYKVDNAIILAAGLSTRFAPFSYEMPKGLMTCRGEVLVERQIEQLRRRA